jgi:uncharacterized protein YecT (DUF1311 family)
MAKRDLTAEILEIKGRAPKRFGIISYSLQSLLNQWNKASTLPDSVPDFYIIRTVTILEVFTRRRVADLVNHADRFATKAATLMKDHKIDYEILRNIHGSVITLGEIVSYSIPANSFGQILSHFEMLLDRPLRVPLATAVDRVRTEIKKQPPDPIIPDYDSMAKSLTRLFEIRHIVTHELPEKPTYERLEIANLISSALQFVTAIEWVLTTELYGKVPLTQTEMNIDAGNKLREKEQELESLMTAIHAKVIPLEDELDALADSQTKWIAYRDAQCEFETFLSKGGTIRPLLWAMRARQITESRIDELNGWLKDRTSTRFADS